MKRRRFKGGVRSVVAAVWILLLVACGGGGGSSSTTTNPSNPPSQTTTNQTITAFVKDAPTNNVLACRVDITGSTLNDASGRAVSLTASTAQFELRHLALAPTLGFAVQNVGTGTYTNLVIDLDNPQLTVAAADGRVQRLTTSSMPAVVLARRRVTVPVSVTISAGSDIGMMFDIDLYRSVTVDAGGNYIFDPVVKAVTVAPNGPELELQAVMGKITSVSPGSANALDVELAGGKTVHVLVDSATTFDAAIGQFSSLRAGQRIEFDARFQSDGGFLAKYMNAAPADPLSCYRGVATDVRVDPLGGGSLEVVVQQ